MTLRDQKLKYDLFKAQGERCNAFCEDGFRGRKLPYDLLHFDHIKPTAEGGEDTDENKQLLCVTCNQRKGKGSMGSLQDCFRQLPLFGRF